MVSVELKRIVSLSVTLNRSVLNLAVAVVETDNCLVDRTFKSLCIVWS